jgi:hypothetical protein
MILKTLFALPKMSARAIPRDCPVLGVKRPMAGSPLRLRRHRRHLVAARHGLRGSSTRRISPVMRFIKDNPMTATRHQGNFTLTPEQQARLQRQREQIAAEQPQLQAKLERIHEAKQEPSLCGQLRLAIHRSGRLPTQLAAEAGITVQQLGDFLSGDRTLRSDVLDRLTAAVGASLVIAERP